MQTCPLAYLDIGNSLLDIGNSHDQNMVNSPLRASSTPCKGVVR